MLMKHNEGVRSERSLVRPPYVVVFVSGPACGCALWNNITCLKSVMVPASSLASLCSCRKSGICTLWHREHQLVDCRRRGDSPACGHHRHLRPVLETVPHRQAGVPARRHGLYSAEAEGSATAKCFIPLVYLLLNWQEVGAFILRTFDTGFFLDDGKYSRAASHLRKWRILSLENVHDPCWHSIKGQTMIAY